MKVKRSLKLFKEVITPENVEAMSEMIAICELKSFMKFVMVPTIDIFNNLYEDINHKHLSGYILTDSYDLVQEIALVLCENFGKKLDDVHHIDKKGKIITIEVQAERKMLKIVNYKSRRMRSDICYEEMLETELPCVECIEDMEECEISLEEYNASCERVNKIISSLNLNEQQRIALECRMNGMSYPEIAKVIQRAVSTTFDCLKGIQKRYLAMYEF